MRTMRSGGTAVTAVVLLAFAVVIMHMGMPPMAMASPPSGASVAHHGAPRAASDTDRTALAPTVVDRADHDTSVQKQSVDAVHDHEAHDCAGTVVAHKTVGAPPLVAVLPLADRDTRATPAARAAAARGPPPWTVFDLAQLCVFRV